MTSIKQPESVSSVLKIFGILQAISEERDIGISDLSQKVMMSKSTVYRFLQTMKTLGIVSQEGDSDKYSMTLKLFELGSKALEHVNLIDLADYEMRKISDKYGESIQLGTLDGDSVVYLHNINASFSLGVQSKIGYRVPSYSSSIGKVFLASKDDQEIKHLFEENEKSKMLNSETIDLGGLLKDLSSVRELGFGEENEDREAGLRSLAVPIYDRFNSVVAGLCISYPSVRYSESVRREYLSSIRDAAERISKKLGCTGYPIH
ncbi:DNA-binding transcriptional regulator KdgR [Parasalinivibrio latis]|uniref:DNA-binding transcriptional regulator KdgR n=1 Tax=Parasalinivibrio latis TaxID=2952610 RepID=UPI0030E51F08